MPKYTVWVQEWETTERGWGVKPCGYTMHLDQTDIRIFLMLMRTKEEAENGKGFVPEEYDRPCGAAYQVDLDDPILYDQVVISRTGIWGKGSIPERPPVVFLAEGGKCLN